MNGTFRKDSYKNIKGIIFLMIFVIIGSICTFYYCNGMQCKIEKNHVEKTTKGIEQIKKKQNK